MSDTTSKPNGRNSAAPDISWILDSDIHSQKHSGFDPAKIASDTMALTGRTYAFFRHVFNDKFLISCGGKL